MTESEKITYFFIMPEKPEPGFIPEYKKPPTRPGKNSKNPRAG